MKTKIKNKLLKGTTPRYVILIIDTYIIINSFILATIINNSTNLLNIDVYELAMNCLVLSGLSVISLMLIGLHKSLVRYSGRQELLSIIKVSALILVFSFSLHYLQQEVGLNFCMFRFRTVVINFVFNILLLSIARFLFVWAYEKIKEDTGKGKNIMIYGAGDSGLITSNTFKKEVILKTNIVGFIDDNKQKKGSKINGFPIYLSESIDKDFIEKNEIKEIIVSIQNLEGDRLAEITDKFSGMVGVKIKVVPPVKDWLNGKLNLQEIQDVKIEDLLGREPIKLNNPMLKKEFKDKIILVTGAAGSIGSEIARQLTTFIINKLLY